MADAKVMHWQKFSDARPPQVGDQVRLHGAIAKWRGKDMKVVFVGRRHDPVTERELEGVWVETVGRHGGPHNRVFRVEVLEWYGELQEPAKAAEAAAAPAAPPPVEAPKKSAKASSAEV